MINGHLKCGGFLGNPHDDCKHYCSVFGESHLAQSSNRCKLQPACLTLYAPCMVLQCAYK